MKIFVLGSTGMLGRYVSTYFKSRQYEVINITRKDLDASIVNERLIKTELSYTDIEQGDVVINCIGIIKQKKDINPLDFIVVNSIFPRILTKVCEDAGAKLICISSDCVFSGLRGLYKEDDPHDASDVYGKTKSLGEPENTTVIRTSIIGEELKGKLSLIEWVKSMKGKSINGFTNHKWNGLTCLQTAKVFEDIIINGKYWQGVRHIFSPQPVSKYELICMINEEYQLSINVIPLEAPIPCDRTLSTIYTDFIFDIPSIKEQIEEQRNYFIKL